MNIPTQLACFKAFSFLGIAICCLPAAMIPALASGGSTNPACEDPQALTFHSAETVAGTMIADVNPLDELTVVIDETGDELAVSVLRMALGEAGGASGLLDQWGQGRREVEVTHRRGKAFSEVVFRFPRPGFEPWVFEIDRLGCTDRPPARTEAPQDRHFALRAYAWNQVAATGEDLESMLDTSLEYALISTAAGEPSRCFAGGPAASACSVEPGTLGDEGFQGCSADCSDMPGYHACCGSGLPGNCACSHDGITGMAAGAADSPAANDYSEADSTAN